MSVSLNPSITAAVTRGDLPWTSQSPSVSQKSDPTAARDVPRGSSGLPRQRVVVASTPSYPTVPNRNTLSFMKVVREGLESAARTDNRALMPGVPAGTPGWHSPLLRELMSVGAPVLVSPGTTAPDHSIADMGSRTRAAVDHYLANRDDAFEGLTPQGQEFARSAIVALLANVKQPAGTAGRLEEGQIPAALRLIDDVARNIASRDAAATSTPATSATSPPTSPPIARGEGLAQRALSQQVQQELQGLAQARGEDTPGWAPTDELQRLWQTLEQANGTELSQQLDRLAETAPRSLLWLVEQQEFKDLFVSKLERMPPGEAQSLRQALQRTQRQALLTPQQFRNEANARGLPLPNAGLAANEALAANEWYSSPGDSQDAAQRFEVLSLALRYNRPGDYVVELQRSDGTWTELNVSAHGDSGNYYALAGQDGVLLETDERGWPLLPGADSTGSLRIEDAGIGEIRVARDEAPSRRARSRSEGERTIGNLVHAVAAGLDRNSEIEQIEAQLASVLADPQAAAYVAAHLGKYGESVRRIDQVVNHFERAQEPPEGISLSDLAVIGWRPLQYGLVLARGREGDIEAFAIKRDFDGVPRVYNAAGSEVEFGNWRDYSEVTFVATDASPAVAWQDASLSVARQAARTDYRGVPELERRFREVVVREVADRLDLTVAQQMLYHEIANVKEPIELLARTARGQERLDALVSALAPLGVQSPDDIARDFEDRILKARRGEPVVGADTKTPAELQREALDAEFSALPFAERAVRLQAQQGVQREAFLDPYPTKLYNCLYVRGIPEDVLRRTERPLQYEVGKLMLENSLSTYLGLENEAAIRADFEARVDRLRQAEQGDEYDQ